MAVIVVFVLIVAVVVVVVIFYVVIVVISDIIPAISHEKVLGSVGEPINPEAWIWYHQVVGGEQCAIVDTFWQVKHLGKRYI